MELETLKKKLSTFKTDKGYLKNVSNDLLLEILSAWENWSGSSKKFYRGIGSHQKSLAKLLGKAKRLKREGYESPVFEEVRFDSSPGDIQMTAAIEMVLDGGRVLRFPTVDTVVDFLKKAS